MPPHLPAVIRSLSAADALRALGLLGVAALWLSFGGSAAAPQPAGTESPENEILGTWQGTSKCTHLELAPACKDEVVVYTIGPLPGDAARSVRLSADKIVDGERVPMGELDLMFDPTAGTWSAELRSPRFQGLWSFRVADGELSGTLVELPSRAQLRAVDASRPSSEPRRSPE